MDELVFDEARSVIVGSTLRAFAADGRPTAEVERLLVHVARTASTQDLVDVAHDLAAQVLSPATWGALCDEPWLAAEMDAAAAAPAPVEVRLVVTGATPEQARRLVDRPFEALGEALSHLADPGADAEAHEPPVGQQDAPPEPDEPGGVRHRGGIGGRGRGRRSSPASSVRAGRRGEPARRAAGRPGSSPSGSRPSASRPGRPGSPGGAKRSRPTAPAPAGAGARGSRGPARGPAGDPSRPPRRRRAPGTATGPPEAARRGSARDRFGRPVVVGGRGPRLPGGPGAAGSRSRDGPDVDR
ncbi:hypothetical protein [Actinomycetospora sp. NBRC 106378]|uniref:hypothetical protein n=1 Tax=Actinomycetospora sp. NBRC 106378 TaxID=3032208 RepID=UPI002556D5B4|nr:hypothetical protein [Actinomycetospora sp. NBRC 106378]